MKSTIVALGLIVAGLPVQAQASDLTFQQAFDQTYPSAPRQGGAKAPVIDLTEEVGREIERQNAQARAPVDNWQVACVPTHDPIATPTHIRGVGFEQVWLKVGDATAWNAGSFTRLEDRTLLKFQAPGATLVVAMSTRAEWVELIGTQADGSWGRPIAMTCGVYQPGPRPQ